MDLSTNNVLFLLGGIELVACVGCALYWLVGRGSEARAPVRRAARTAAPRRPRRGVSVHDGAAEPSGLIPAGPEAESQAAPVRDGRRMTDAETVATTDDPADTGRHHVPDVLLHSPTYRLSADRLARARVPGADELSYQIPGPGRPQPKRRKGTAPDDASLRS
jgi:hypothetical protein